MGINVDFMQSTKRLNSTKILTSSISGDFSLSCELKDVTNLYTPTLIMSSAQFTDGLGNIINPLNFVYCRIADFGRYYFIRDWSWIVGRWECTLEVDVLASFKTAIGNTTAYVLRSASNYDTDIVDTKYPVKAAAADGSYQTQTYGSVYNVWNTNIYGNDVTAGFFRVSIVNDDSSAIGAVSHYALSGTVMAELMDKLYSSPSWMNITDANISQDLQKMLMNPLQYITSVIWIPTGFNTTGQTPIHTIPYGWWSVTLTGDVYRITTGTMQKTITESISVAHHPQYDAKKHWLQLSPYTTAALYFTPFGFIPLDTSKFYDATHIDIEVRVDIITGKGTLIISSHKTVGGTTTYGGIFYTTTAQVGVPMTIAQMAVDMSGLGQASTWIGAAGVVLAAGGLQDSLKDLKNGLIDGVRDIFNNPSKNKGVQRASNAISSVVGGGIGSLVNDLAKSGAAGGGIGAAIGALGGKTSAPTSRIFDLPAMAQSVGAIPESSGSGGSSLLSTLKQIAGDIGSAALAAAGTCQSSGSSGGFAALSEMLMIQWYFQQIVNQDPTHYGYPLCQSKKISTLSGFILCQNADDFTASCTPAERQAILGFMEAGFYYE